MKVQECYFKCDHEGCDTESSRQASFTEARKVAEQQGWVIHPSSGENQRHLCPGSVVKLMELAGVPAGPVGEKP